MTPNISGVGRALFGCALGKAMTAEARQRCRTAGAIMPKQGGPNVLIGPEHARHATRWAYDLAKKKAPLLLPCMSPHAALPSLGTLLCLGDMLVNGYHPDKDMVGSYARAGRTPAQ